MNKSERLNDMLFYLRDKRYFNLSDLMSHYRISKSTALRDISSLELMGLPIYSNLGRYGNYIVDHDHVLTPVIFNNQEIMALYFSMNALQNYESTPFQVEFKHIKTKFKDSIPSSLQTGLSKMEKSLSISNYSQVGANPMLPKLFDLMINQKVVHLKYGNNDESRTVQFYEISSSLGHWYISAFDINKQAFRVFRCDRIKNVTPSVNMNGEEIEVLISRAGQFHLSERPYFFSVEVQETGHDIFNKEHYPNMNWVSKENKFYIEGIYNPNEIQFLARYFLQYGTLVKSIQPKALEAEVRILLDELVHHFNN